MATLRRRLRLSESAAAATAGLARASLRKAEARDLGSTLGTLDQLARALQRELYVALTTSETSPDCSTVAVSLNVVRDGDDSWKLHFMDLVDEFRRTLDGRLVCLPPTSSLPLRLRVLLGSIVLALCEETAVDAPTWAQAQRMLEQPWFPAGMESLKASALVESPLAFRRNNIFVLANFLSRA